MQTPTPVPAPIEPSRPRPPVLACHAVAADNHAVPAPFRAFAVRSDEALHAMAARAPYGRVHVTRTDFVDAESRSRLAAAGFGRVRLESFSDIDYAPTSFTELADIAPGVPDLPGRIAGTLQSAGVPGLDAAACRRCVETRVDFLASRGAGFHNDVARHFSRCLFWLLALDVADVEFVMPHAGVRLPLAPGDLLVFDPALAHGLCRPADGGQAVAASFESGPHCQQIFLTGELLLDDAQWSALGAPWLPVEEHEGRGALDLLVAEFDDRSGAIKRLRALRDGMQRSVCHVDGMPGGALTSGDASEQA